MNGTDRKAAVAAYKERKVIAGIYAVHCQPTGEVWVGKAPDLSTIQNRIWFTLGAGMHPQRELQALWKEHGSGAFSFESVEAIEEEPVAFAREAVLKRRLQHWRNELKATGSL